LAEQQPVEQSPVSSRQCVETSVTFFSGDGLQWRAAAPIHYENGDFLDPKVITPRVHFEQGGLFRWNGNYHLIGQQVAPWVWQPDGMKVGRVMSVFRSRDMIHWEPDTAFGVHQEIVWPTTSLSRIDVDYSFCVRVKWSQTSDARVFALYLEQNDQHLRAVPSSR